MIALTLSDSDASDGRAFVPKPSGQNLLYPYYIMKICCLKCRTKTASDDLKPLIFKNGGLAVTGKCAKCGRAKYLIAGRKTGGSLINTLLNKLPMPEVHLALPKTMQSEYRPSGSFNNIRKYSFCGPFTKIKKRIAEAYKGINKLDDACLQHDLVYTGTSDVKDRNRADDNLASKAAQLITETSTPDYEKQDSRPVTGVMATKPRFGM